MDFSFTKQQPRPIKQSFARTIRNSRKRLTLELVIVQWAVGNKAALFYFFEKQWSLKSFRRCCWARKRCFPEDSRHCETSAICLVDKKMICHRCGGVSIELGGKEQLLEWKQRMLRFERPIALAFVSHCQSRHALPYFVSSMARVALCQYSAVYSYYPLLHFHDTTHIVT